MVMSPTPFDPTPVLIPEQPVNLCVSICVAQGGPWSGFARCVMDMGDDQ